MLMILKHQLENSWTVKLIVWIWPKISQFMRFLSRPLGWVFYFSRYVVQQFIFDRCLQTAAALTYASLLSLVPFLTVGFSIFSAFPVFEAVSEQIQDFIFDNFVPASQEILQDYFISFAQKASHLTAVGVVSLVFTALLLVETIDHTLNDIWKVHKHERRKGVSVFMVYWAVLSLGPLLVGFSLVATSYLVSLPFISGVAQNVAIKQLFLSITPFLLSASAFTLIYVVVPYRYVPLHHGILGGLLAALLFEIAKKGFAFYVTHFPTYELVYGTLAVIPIFLIWVYLSWLIILLGAEITRALTSFQRSEESSVPCIPGNALMWSFRILGHLWEGQRSHSMISFNDLLYLEPSFSDTSLEALLNHLEKTLWIHRTMKGYYGLSRDLHDTTLFDLYRDLSGLLLKPQTPIEDDWDKILDEVFDEVQVCLKNSLDIPLIALYQGKWQQLPPLLRK